MSVDKPTNVIIDFDATLEMCNKNTDIAHNILKMFHDELPLAKEALIDSYTHKDQTKCAATTHKLLGSLSICIVPTLYNIVKTFDTNSCRKTFSELQSLIDITMHNLEKLPLKK